MKINFKSQFYSEFGTVLVILVLNHKTVSSSEGLTRMQLCEAVKEETCVILCRDCNLDIESGVKELKQILEQEGKMFKTCTLTLERCIYTNQTKQDWRGIKLGDNPKIEDLKIFHSSIDINKMSLELFKNLRRLTIKNTTTACLRVEVFRQLPELQELRIKQNSFLKCAQKGFLQNLSLNYLQIQGVNLNQEKTAEFFKNLTGGRAIPSVRELDWSHNNFGSFSKDLLSYFPNLNTLILTNSNIFNFEEETFSGGSIKSAFIDRNRIQKLPEKIFGSLLENASFVAAEGNELICDCDMEWLQNLMKKHRRGNIKIECSSPVGVTFLEAEMCPKNNSENSDSSTAHCTPKENLELSDDYNSWSNAMKTLPMFNETSTKFTVTNDEPEFVEITLSHTVDLERVYLWYGSYANTTAPQFSCLKILQYKFNIYVTPDVNHLICLATIYKYFQIDIFDCIPFKTKPLYENQSWLTKKSISLSIISIFVVFLFALAVGALILYLSVRKNPSLIRGSKRVIEVKRHDKAQILIMPRGYESVNQADGASVALMNPHLPLGPSRSCDTISTVSYVSANQPTQLEILTYRLNRLREFFQRNNNLPPPVSSLPMQIATPINQRLPPNVDLLFEYEWYTITTTTTQV